MADAAFRGRFNGMDRRHTPRVALLMVAVLGITGLLDLAATRGPLGIVQDKTSAYLDMSERKAIEAFAVARSINAAVSVLKSADFSALVAQVAPLQVLEPVDDLAKQFSDVMVVSLVAILVQRLVLHVSQAWALGLVLPAGCVVLTLAGLAGRRPGLSLRMVGLGRLLVILALFARFVVPVACLVGESVTQRFLAGDLDTSMRVLHASGDRLDRVTDRAALPADAAPAPVSAAAPSAIDRFANGVRQALQSATDSTRAAIEQARSWIPDRAAINAFVVGVPEQIVRAIAVFLVQTMLVPIGVSLLFYLVLRAAFRPMRGVVPGLAG